MDNKLTNMYNKSFKIMRYYRYYHNKHAQIRI